ncbi:MAG: choice-of-anchor J domain-containing protein [Dokdonella sp.]
MYPQPIIIAAVLACVVVAPLSKAQPATKTPAITCTEGFENVAQLTSRGWIIINRSDLLGTTSWFQGVPARFPAQAGPSNSYASSDALNASGQDAVLSTWLITPDIPFADGSTLDFATRELSAPTDESNRLEVLACFDSISQSCTNVGDSSGSLGGFVNALVIVNPGQVQGGYPSTWTFYSVTQAMGMPQSGHGRIAFHHYGNGHAMDPIGTTIGVDTVTVGQVVSCPFTDVVFNDGFESR